MLNLLYEFRFLNDHLSHIPCREKLGECGTFLLYGMIRFLLVDHSKPTNGVSANLTYRILMSDGSSITGRASELNDTSYLISLEAKQLGNQIIAVYLDGKQLANSPFLFDVQMGTCPNSSGRVMDIDGRCVCPPIESVDVSGSCVLLRTLVPAVVVPSLVVISLIIIAAFRHSVAKSEDLSWRIKPSEVVFPDPIDILGRGSKGDVLRVTYRGTPVALKRFKYQKHESQFLQKKSCWLALGIQDTSNRIANTNDSWSEWKSNASSSLTEGKSASSAISFKRLLQDVKTLARIRHPYLTTVMGALLTDAGQHKEISIVMEVMDLGSMWDLLRNEMYPIHAEKALRFLQDITKGMHFLHDATPPIVHGDLKSTNILIDRNFCAKISDFGLYWKKKSLNFWSAPECLSGQECTTLSDVYSFGVVVYEVVSRKVPFEFEGLEQDVLAAISRGALQLPEPSGCSAQVYSLMTDCLCLKSINRPPFAELSRRLDAMDVKLMTSHAFTADDTGLRDSVAEEQGRQSMLILRDLFPLHVADALMRGEKVPPERKEMITMYFSDIVGFTTLSASLSPEKVSDLLDRLFGRLDALAGNLGVYKVDTIGDAYLCATNVLMDDCATHAVAMAHFALAALISARETPINLDDPAMGHVRIRVGLSSGPCMASVVGSRNPKYTFFGDTINTASRMESTSIPGYAQCSQRTAELIRAQDTGSGIRVVQRGSISIKGKGDMTTYWILLPDQDPPQQGDKDS